MSNINYQTQVQCFTQFKCLTIQVHSTYLQNVSEGYAIIALIYSKEEVGCHSFTFF